MGLDLSSLKKINTTTDSTPVMSHPTEAQESAPVVASVIPEPIQVRTETAAPIAPAPVAAPVVSSAKISLSSLRGGPKPVEASKPITIPSVAINTAPTTIVEETHEKQPEGWQPIVITEAPLTVEAIVHDTPIDAPFDLDEDEPQEVTKGIEEIAQEVKAEKQESLSLGSEEEVVQTEAAEEIEKKVEYFPNLDILGGLTFDDDFLGGEIAPKDSHSTILEINPKQTIKPIEVVAIEEIPEVVAVETPEIASIVETTVASPEEAIEETKSKPITSNTQEILAQEEITLAINSAEDEEATPVVSEIIEKEPKIGFITKIAGFFSIIGAKLRTSRKVTTLEKIVDSAELIAIEATLVSDANIAETEVIPEEVKATEIEEAITEKDEITQVAETTPTEDTTKESSLTESIKVTDPITPEYVAEIKQELSENRKVGGLARFKKIVVTVALSGILILGGVIGFNGILKNIKPTTKINILENTTQNPPVTITKPVTKAPTNSLATLSGTTNIGTTLAASGVTNSGSVLTGSGTKTTTGNTLSGATTPTNTNTGTLIGTGTMTPPANTGTGETLSGTTSVNPSGYTDGNGYKSIPNTKKNIPRTK